MSAGVFGGLIEGVMGLIGRADQQKKEYRAEVAANEAALRQEANQREFAQHGVRWRVEDAKAAGLHPLFALGANTASYSPVAHVMPETGSSGASLARAGQAFGRAISAQETQQQRDMAMEQLALLKAQRGRTEAETISIYDEMYRRGSPSAGNAFPNFGNDVVVGAYRPGSPIESHPLFQDAVKLRPDEMVSRSAARVGETAGRGHPSMREFQMPNGDLLLLPATGQGGIPEEIDMAMLPEIVGANIRRFGSYDAVVGALHRWFGGKLNGRRPLDAPRIPFRSRHERVLPSGSGW